VSSSLSLVLIVAFFQNLPVGGYCLRLSIGPSFDKFQERIASASGTPHPESLGFWEKT
jgi:hypothetical protein